MHKILKNHVLIIYHTFWQMHTHKLRFYKFSPDGGFKGTNVKILNWLIIFIWFLKIIGCKRVFYWQCCSVSALSAVLFNLISTEGFYYYWSPLWKGFYWQCCSVSSLVVFYITWYILNHSSPITIFGADPLFCPQGFVHLKTTSPLLSICEAGLRASSLKGTKGRWCTSRQYNVLHTVYVYDLFQPSPGL